MHSFILVILVPAQARVQGPGAEVEIEVEGREVEAGRSREDRGLDQAEEEDTPALPVADPGLGRVIETNIHPFLL